MQVFQKYLKDISRVEMNLISPIKDLGYGNVNTTIFTGGLREIKSGEHKIVFFQNLSRKEKLLLTIQQEVQKDSIEIHEKKVLLGEIYSRLRKISFLREVYDIEVQKIVPDIIIFSKPNYDSYNTLFFGVSHKDLEKKYQIEDCAPPTIIFSKQEVIQLIKFSHSIIPDIVFNFGDFPNFSHSKGKINITENISYNLQSIISIFFHETTHFFRGYNGERNLGFRYTFEDYNTLEEGIAIYNEYKYGNKLTSYGKFNPYYNVCYQILSEDIRETEKKEKIHKVLACKGYNKEKSLGYYHRFNKYSQLGKNHFFLKDLVYESGYRNVKKLLRKDTKNYEKIMSGHIGLYELEENVIPTNNNFDTRFYFNKMVGEIKKYVLKK